MFLGICIGVNFHYLCDFLNDGRGRNVSEPWLNYFSGQTSCKFVKTYYLISGSLLVKQLNSCIASASVNARRVSLPRSTPPPKPARMLQLQFPAMQTIRMSSFIRFPPSTLTLRGNENTVLPRQNDEERYLAASPSAGVN